MKAIRDAKKTNFCQIINTLKLERIYLEKNKK